MISIVVFMPSSMPAFICWFQRLAVGSVISFGLPTSTSLMTPSASEWSATTSQSSGRDSRTGWPVLDLISSPRARRNASSGPTRVPPATASPDHEVCRCWSPHSGRVGKLRPA